MSDRWFNLGLRLISLGSRFLLVILLAKSMQIEDFAFYGLFAASVAYSVYVIGIDFYTFTVRDLVTQPKPYWRALLRDQFLLYSGTFAIFIGFSLVLLATSVINGNTLIWLLLLLASEHLAQELSRLLIITGKVLQSSIALFIRSGLWVMILAGLWWKNPSVPLQLHQVFSLWLSGGILAIVWSIWCLRQVLYDHRSAGAPINWVRMRTGIRVAAIFFAGTLVLKFGSTADRFLVEHFAGLAAVGPYVLYIGLAGAIAAVVDASVVVYEYPGLIRSWQTGDEDEFHSRYNGFLRRVLLYALGSALLLGLFLHPVLNFIDKQHLQEAWPIAVPLVLANVLLALANVPHYALYAAQEDRSILVATVIGTTIFLMAAVITGPLLGALAVAWSVCLSALAILISKFIIWRRVLRLKIWTKTPKESLTASLPVI